MPTYTGECGEHGRFEDLMRVRDYEEDGGLFCPKCKNRARTVLHATPTIGAMPSKPLHIDQIGQTFYSEAEKRAYFAKRPDRKIVEPGDTAFTKHKDLAREKAENASKQLGFRDLEDRKSHNKKEISRKREIAHGDKKIQVITTG